MSLRGWIPGALPAIAGPLRPVFRLQAATGYAAGSAAGLARLVLDDMLVIRVIILRDLKTKYLNHPLGLLLEFLKPIVICAVHYFYFSISGRVVPGNQYLVFVLGGFTIWFCFIGGYHESPKRAAGGITSIPGVTPMHLHLATAVWSFFTYFVFANLVAYPCLLVGGQIQPPDVLLTVITYSLASGLAFGFGLLTQALVTVLPALNPFVKLFKWFLFITSGIYDSMATMSPIMAPYIWYNPLIHLAEFQRHAFDPGYPVFLVTLAYPALVMAGLISSGLVCNRILANRQAARLPR